MRPVPVIAYHHVNENKGDMITVTPEVFERQMRYLSDSGYRTLRAGELLAYINGGLSLDEKSVMITFDDGWLDNYIYAFPILRKYNINATIFLATDWIDKASENAVDLNAVIPGHKESFSLVEQGEGHKVLLTWEFAEEMVGSGLVEFHSHTKSHRKCHELSSDELKEELSESKGVMEERFGRPCTSLCWPSGRNNALSMKIARENGYNLLFTTRHGIVEKGSDPLSIDRIAVRDSAFWLRKSMIIYTNNILSKMYLGLKRK